LHFVDSFVTAEGPEVRKPPIYVVLSRLKGN